MPNFDGTDPVDEKLFLVMQALARTIDELLNDDMTNRKNGFVLMIFPFEGRDGKCNYISNALREDMVSLMKDQIKRFEATANDPHSNNTDGKKTNH